MRFLFQHLLRRILTPKPNASAVHLHCLIVRLIRGFMDTESAWMARFQRHASIIDHDVEATKGFDALSYHVGDALAIAGIRFDVDSM